MSVTARLVEKLGDKVTRSLASAIHAMPHYDAAEDTARRDHDRWKRTARTGIYFLPDAHFEWVGVGYDDPQLVCHGAFNFTRDHGDLFWTADGKTSSWHAWWRSGGNGLHQREPIRPKLQGLGAGSEYAKRVAAQGWDNVQLFA